MGMLSNLVAAVKRGLRLGKVKQDDGSTSKVSDAEVEAFKAIQDPHLQYVYVSKPRRNAAGQSYVISADMTLNPARYGFADAAAVKQWFADNEIQK